MIFVYLPSYSEIREERFLNYNKEILSLISHLKIPTIDIYETVFKNHKDPLALFPKRSPGHYNEKGYELTTDAIIEFLNKNFYIE